MKERVEQQRSAGHTTRCADAASGSALVRSQLCTYERLVEGAGVSAAGSPGDDAGDPSELLPVEIERWIRDFCVTTSSLEKRDRGAPERARRFSEDQCDQRCPPDLCARSLEWSPHHCSPPAEAVLLDSGLTSSSQLIASSSSAVSFSILTPPLHRISERTHSENETSRAHSLTAPAMRCALSRQTPTHQT